MQIRHIVHVNVIISIGFTLRRKHYITYFTKACQGGSCFLEQQYLFPLHEA